MPTNDTPQKAQTVLSQILLGLDEYASFNSGLHPFGVEPMKMSYVFAAQCAELIRSQEAELTRLKGELERIAKFQADDDTIVAQGAFNEWGEAEAFRMCQSIAEKALSPSPRATP